MASNLDMGENLITNIGYAKDILAVNNSLLDSEIAGCLKRDGSNPAGDDLSMDGNAMPSST